MLTQADLQQLGQLFDTKMDEKLEPINTRLDGIDHRLGIIEQDQSHMSTTLEALATKGDVETAVSTAKEEIQADLLTLGARITRTVHNHQTRIKNLEKHTDTTDPIKN